MCKDTADDLMGARLAWRGERPGKFRSVRLKQEPVSAKPVSPPVEAAPKKATEATEFKAVKPPITFTKPQKKEKEPAVVKPISPPVVTAPKKTVSAPEIKVEKPPMTFRHPLKKEKAKKAVAAPKAPAVETPKDKTPPSFRGSMPPFLNTKEKIWLDEKLDKAMTRSKRGKSKR